MRLDELILVGTLGIRSFVLVRTPNWVLTISFPRSASQKLCTICNSGETFDARVGIRVPCDILNMSDKECFRS